MTVSYTGLDVIVHSTVYAISGLPSASNFAGMQTMISDSSVTGTFGSTLGAGGGSIYSPVYSDGTNWRFG